MPLTLAATLMTLFLFVVFLLVSEGFDRSPLDPLSTLTAPCCSYGIAIR